MHIVLCALFYFLGIITCVATEKVLNGLETDEDKFYKLPILDDEALNTTIKALETIAVRDKPKLQDDDRLALLYEINYLKKYRLNYAQAGKLRSVFTYYESYKKVNEYIKYNLIVSEYIKNAEIETVEKMLLGDGVKDN